MTAHPSSAHEDHDAAPAVVLAAHAPEAPHVEGVERMIPQVKAQCIAVLQDKVAAAESVEAMARWTDKHHVSTGASLLTPGILDAGVSAGLGVHSTWKALSSGASLTTVARNAWGGMIHTVASVIPLGSTVYKWAMKPVTSSANRMWVEVDRYAENVLANGVDRGAVTAIVTAAKTRAEAASAEFTGTVKKAVTGVAGSEVGRDFLADGLDYVAGTPLPRHRHIRTGATTLANGLRRVNGATRAAHAAHGAHPAPVPHAPAPHP